MKGRAIYWVALGLALALCVAVCDGLKIRDKASVIAGQYEEALAIAKANATIKDALIVEQSAAIDEKDKAIVKLNESISVIYTDIGNRDRDIADLISQLHALETQGNNFPAQIVNLKAQVKAWADKFTLAESIIAEKDAIISSWAAKYAAQVQISEAWKQRYESENHLHLLAKEGWDVTARKLQRTRIVSNIEKGILVVFGGAVLYRTIKGK